VENGVKWIYDGVSGRIERANVDRRNLVIDCILNFASLLVPCTLFSEQFPTVIVVDHENAM